MKLFVFERDEYDIDRLDQTIFNAVLYTDCKSIK